MGRQHGSSNWLKVQKHTWQKGEIRQVARTLGISLGDAFLAWFRLYAVLDELTADGSIPFYSAADADQDAGLKGAGQAFAKVGWLLFDQHGCTVVNWKRHNGESAKARALKAERQARYRDAAPSTGVDAEPSTGRRVDAMPSTPVDARPSTRVVARPWPSASPEQSRAEQRYNHLDE